MHQRPHSNMDTCGVTHAGQAVSFTPTRADAQMFTYCPLGNHCHVVLHTRRANVSLLMGDINSV